MIGLTLGLYFSTKQTFFKFFFFFKNQAGSGFWDEPPVSTHGRYWTIFFLFWAYKAVTDKLVHLKSSVCEEI